MPLSRFKNMFIDKAINKAIIKINFAFASKMAQWSFYNFRLADCFIHFFAALISS